MNMVGQLLSTFLPEDTEIDAEAVKEEIQNLVAQFKPLIYAVLGEGFEMYKDLIKNDEFFEQLAQMKRKTYNAYIAAGFTPEQAMVLLLDAGVARSKIIKNLLSSIQKPQISE